MISTSNIAVIILNYFDAKITYQCCQSILKEIDVHFFLIENSATCLEKNRLVSAITSFKKQTTLLFPGKNLGFSAGVNLGLKEAIKRGFKQFIVINNDAKLKKGSGKALKQAFSQNKCCLMSPKLYWNDKIIGGRYYHKYTGIMFDDNSTTFLARYYPRLGFLFYLTGCALAFDKTLLDKIGFFDEDFFMYGEDVEFSHRASAKGCNLILLDEVFVEHEGSKSAQKGSFFYEFYTNRSHLLLAEKLSLTPLEKFFSYIGKFSYLLSRSIFRMIKYNSLIPIKAFLLSLKYKRLPDSNYDN